MHKSVLSQNLHEIQLQIYTHIYQQYQIEVSTIRTIEQGKGIRAQWCGGNAISIRWSRRASSDKGTSSRDLNEAGVWKHIPDRTQRPEAGPDMS